MECGGVISEVNCVSYHAYNQADECEMMSQFFSSELNVDAQSFFWADQAANVNYFEHPFGHTNSTDCNSDVSFIAPPVSEYESYYQNGSNEALGININSNPPSVDLSLVQEQNANTYQNLTPNPTNKENFYPNSDEDASNEEQCDSGMNLLQSVGLSEMTAQPKRKFDELDCPIGSPVKKSPMKRSAKKGKAKEAQRKEEEESNGSIVEGMSSIGYNSDDESNGSGDSGLRSKRSPAAKTRAGRGSATDPQSLYARKRRERINEKLRILQNLVPNGTKVDMSTMLEDAVQYVNFLQLQIKMLSSDEHWMYSPIAYNGMNIGLDLKIV
ncbi:Helix-loop-helix DNA-binding domain containing protein [Carex littledalei]|uniref:Helix-loop-helix DNA-binding domain containing protein n=1 Tax=Carex littledalei TaxID=544730 RepID=A0A833VCH1_9POAL|nr:Helix-loop-helix DNA-binding domain containing protein [Carex littledalei]